MTRYELTTFFCEDCHETFKASPEANCYCRKCMKGHILCPACKAVHQLSAAQQDHYLQAIEP